MSRIRKISSRRRPQAADQGCRQAAAQSGAAPLPARRREPRCAHLAHRLRHHRQPVGREGADEDFLFQRPRAGAGCSIPTRWRRPIRTARSRGRSRSTPTIPRRTRPRSTRRTTSSRSAAWSTTRNPGRSTSSMRCPRRRRSPAMSASKAGARSASGRACGSPNSCGGSAPTRARSMSGSAAPRAIRPRSTWRPRCIRRRR